MRISLKVLVVAAAPWLAAGCSSSDDPAAAPGTGGQAGAEADAAQEAEPEGGEDGAVEGSAGAAGQGGADGGADAPQGDCKQPPRKFWVYDLSVMPPKYVEVAASCQAQGDHAYLYVADDIWGTDMNLTDVDQVMTAFEKTTPVDGAKGIFDVSTGVFGATTDVDKDGHVFLLYFEIKPYQGNQFDGFIRIEDMTNGTKGNNAEVLYLDGVRNDPGGEYMLGVVAHEFEHLIAVNHNPNQASWLSETMAETSMIACGYYGDLDDWVPSFAGNPTQTVTMEQPGVNYGAVFLLGGYMFERFGAGFFTALSDETSTGIGAVNAVLTAQGKPDTFKTLLGDWAAANFLDAPTIGDGKWGYKLFDVPAMAATSATVPAAASSLSLKAYSAKYVVYTVDAPASSSLAITLQSTSNANLTFRVAAYPDTDKSAATVASHAMAAADDTLVVTGVGGSVNRVMLAAVENGGAAATVTVSAALQ